MAVNSLLGGCAKGPSWNFDGKNWIITIPHCVSGDNLVIPRFKGVQFEGDPTVYEPDAETCIITLPVAEDQFTTCQLGANGRKAVLTIPGKEAPLSLTVNAIDGAVEVDAEGNKTPLKVEDCILQLPAPEQICWGGDDNGCPVVGIKHCETGEFLVLDFVKSVTGPGVTSTDAKNIVVGASSMTQDSETGVITHTPATGDPTTADTKHSTTVSVVAGFHDITTDDNVTTRVCLTPVKTVNGVTPDINGNVNAADLFSTTTDNGDGTYTTVNADGTPITWSGDTFASGADNGDGTATITFSDGSSLTFCLNPVKSVVQNADGFGATVTLADGTTGQLVYATSSAVSNGDGTTTTTHSDGSTHTSCDNPVKDVLDSDGNSIVVDGVAQLPEDVDLQLPTFVNGDGAALVDDQGPNADSFCVQEPLRTCDEAGEIIQVPKQFCIAPLLKETCEFKATTGWYALVAARTGVLSYSLTDPLTGACATVNVDSPVGPIAHFELASGAFPRLSAAVDSEYSLFLAWAKGPNAFGGCESVVEWRTRMNDFDAVASGQSSVTPFQTPDSVAGVFAESPAGTYVTDAVAGQNANVAIINEYASLDIPAPWGFSAVQFAGDLTTLVVQLRTTEAVKVFRDCDGNFVKAYSGLTGLVVTEAELA